MNLIVSPAPHIKTRRTTRTIMLDVLIALLPASAAGIVFFGWEAAVFIAISLAGAFLTELVWYLIQHKVWTDSGILKDFFRQFDLTSLVTGLLLALCLPAQIEAWYMPLIGSIFAVGVAKMLFGGTGKNIVNPALAGRIMLFISFTAMTMYPAANFGPIATDAANFDPSAGSTQLGNFLSGQPMLSALDLFLGTGVAGCIGETCKLALLVGYLYLCVRGVIKWYLPLLYIVTTGLFAMALEGGFGINLFAEAIFSGGLFLGAIFMATDYVTTPKTTLGNIIYFIALGLFTAGLRKAVGIEVVSFAIFLMNFVVFLLDLVIRPRPFGSVKTRRAKQ
ncbi:MAG TPA: RnfABCDGE type electron transport complex subunit D [Candidatus Gallimonas intestinigallinarum]|uniref:RnfABCDGE type electron transport complex subunit D n=1 Tax=Candidatus Gallimonas intestinigallinarum TaxID=2838604 RepID=A0A9D2DWI9_9FIRM|nr:RnfABCDGE type electron transport complex subunit D [Candidatus Gallimonas intestinigallinarum]